MTGRAGIRLLLAGLLLAAVAAPAGRPAAAAEPPVEGLPERLPVPSPWAPLVTRDPIFVGTVVVPGRVAHGSHHDRFGDGLFVVDSEGEHYRRLPWTGDGPDPLVTLSADGRWVAWTANPERGGDRIHVLDLGGRSARDVALPPSGGRAVIRRLIVSLEPPELLVLGDVTPDAGPRASVLWRLDLTGTRLAEVCRCAPRLALDPDGKVWLRDGDPALADELGLRRFSSRPPTGGPVTTAADLVPPDVVWDGGRRYAEMVADGRLRVVGPDGEREWPVPGSRLLGQGPGFVLVGSSGAAPFAVFRVSPDTGGVQPLVRSDLPGGAAASAVAARYAEAEPVPGPSVEVPWWSVERRAYLAWRALPAFVGAAVLVLAGIVGVILLVRRRTATR